MARPAPTSARAIYWPLWTAGTRPSHSPGGSCSATGRTPSGWSAVTTSSPRIWLTELQAIVVEDRDGIASGLDEAMQRPVDAYRDPWQEHRQPGSATRCRWSSCPRCRPDPPTYSFPRRRNDDKRVGDRRRAAQTWPG